MDGLAEHTSSVLNTMDPRLDPEAFLERLWQEVASWPSVLGIHLEWRCGATDRRQYVFGNRIAHHHLYTERCNGHLAHFQEGERSIAVRRLPCESISQAITCLILHREDLPTAALLIDLIFRYAQDHQLWQQADQNQQRRPALQQHAISRADCITQSPHMNAILNTAERAAASTATVLIQGETGTGKEMLARFIHAQSQREKNTLYTINAGALPPSLLDSKLFGHVAGAYTGADKDQPGLFEVAHGGTVFIDEVGELTAEAQVRLLRALQDRTICRLGDHRSIPIDVRIISATNRDLEEEVRNGRFRQDLLYRLNVVTLNIPPLRERIEDIPALAQHFVQRYNREFGKQVSHIPDEALRRLENHPWPGNIRELENVVQKAIALSEHDQFDMEHIPACADTSCQASHEHSVRADMNGLDPSKELERALQQYAHRLGADITTICQEAERVMIIYALNQERGVKLRAAKRLGINRVTLDRKLVEYQINVQRGQGVLE